MSGFFFDAKAALEAARKGHTLSNRPDRPSRGAAEAAGLGGLGRLGTVGGSDPEISPQALVRDRIEDREDCCGQVWAGDIEPDSASYLDRLCLYGPATYGAMASAMGWGATRAWRAEAELSEAGLIQFKDGKGTPKSV